MKYSIVFSSRTGNTKLLAEQIKTILPEESLISSGQPSDEAAEADLIFLGFWTDKGCCDETLSAFLRTLNGAGFGQSETYFQKILSRVRELIPASCQVIGSFMCQGKMPVSVRKRYEGLMEQDPEKARALIANFDQALTHPDQNDLQRLTEKIRELHLDSN